jgi:hypothetical protein
MGVDTNLTIVDWIMILTIETHITPRGLLHTVIVLIFTLIFLLMLYKWIDRRRKKVTVHSSVAPTVGPAVEWTRPVMRKNKKAKHNKKGPGHIPAYDEWSDFEAEHRQMLAEQAKERVRAKRRAKRKRNRNNRWFREGN